jgi:hypothetical protein
MFAPPNIVHKDGAYYVFRYDLEHLSPEDRKLVFVPASVVEQMQAQHRLHLLQQQQQQQQQQEPVQSLEYTELDSFVDHAFSLPLDDFLPVDLDLLDLSLLQDYDEPLLSSSSPSVASDSDQDEPDEAIQVDSEGMASPPHDPPSQQSSGISLEVAPAGLWVSPTPRSVSPAPRSPSPLPLPALVTAPQQPEQEKSAEQQQQQTEAPFAVGDKLRAADFRGYWFSSRVVAVDLPGRRFLVCGLSCF